jgi:type IV secretory pathway VirB10-like protein
MKTITAIILAIILLAVSIGTRTVFAQDGGDDGYPVETEATAAPTEAPPEPTAPPEPAPAASQPTPNPPAATPEPTEAVPFVAIPQPTRETNESSPVCVGDSTIVHPVISRLAEHYGSAYAELLDYFCEYNLGVGEIDLLLETFRRLSDGTTMEAIFAMRVDEGMGWGEIWQALGLQGVGEGNPEGAGQPEVFKRNENRAKYNHQASNAGDENQLKNEFKPETPPGQEHNGNSNKPATPLGVDKSNQGNDPPGNDKKP